MRRAWIVGVILAIPSGASAQEAGVELRSESRLLEVGETADAQLICTNIGQPEAPSIVAPDGLELQIANSIPMQSSFTSIVNGRTTQRSTFTYSLKLTGKKPGTYTLGPITVRAGGATYETTPVTITVREPSAQSGSEGDQIVFARVHVEPATLYVTQTIRATLTLGIRKLEIRGRRYDVNLLKLLDQSSSNLAAFGDNPRVRSTETSLTDAQGHAHEYGVYHLSVELRAEQVGELTIGPVFIRVNYPTRLQRGFFGDLEVVDAVRHTARVEGVPVTIKGPPLEGRPAEFSGAIGQYFMRAVAKPEGVSQGQPVTLSIIIEGRPLEGVAGPDLSANSDLVSRFDFSTDEPSGDMEQANTKVFRRAIFPKQVGEQTIPPITWAYFDPQAERYVTLRSEPLPLNVDPASSTSAASATAFDHSISDRTGFSAGSTRLRALQGGLSPNYVDPALLLAHQPISVGSIGLAVIVGLPPLLFLASWRSRRTQERLRADPGIVRRRTARKNAHAALARALRCPKPGEQWQGLADAVTGYLSNRFNLPPGEITPADAADILRSHKLDKALAGQVSQFLAEYDAMRYAPGADLRRTPRDAAAGVRHWIDRIESSLR